MSLSLIALVLLAAVLHASWNALVKTSGDKLIVLMCIMMVAGLMSALFLPFVGVPDKASWPYLILSIGIHSAYYFSLVGAYNHGDLSHVYPLARGSAPLIVLLGGILFASEIPTTNQWMGVLIVSAGIISLAFERGLTLRQSNNRALVYALLTGFSIAAYTLTDGIGVRLSGDAPAYIFWLFALEFFPLYFYTIYKRPGQIVPFLKVNWRFCLAGGVASAAAYGIVIYALGQGFMAGISALRETSVVIATFIGIFIFKEKNAVRRIMAGIVVTLGVVLMNL